MKRVFIVHGWEGSPGDCWFPWLKKKLEAKGFTVEIPSMPNPGEPIIKDWVNHIAGRVGKPDQDTYFVGHSIGCQAILRYLEELSDVQVGGVVCVAGFFRLPFLETEEEKVIAKPWLEEEIDFSKVKSCAGKIAAIFSDNDPYVDLGDKELFEKNLGAETIVEHDKGHFSDDAGIKELPSALDAVVMMAGQS